MLTSHSVAYLMSPGAERGLAPHAWPMLYRSRVGWDVIHRTFRRTGHTVTSPKHLWGVGPRTLPPLPAHPPFAHSPASVWTLGRACGLTPSRERGCIP
jgi:hypothetical protein